MYLRALSIDPSHAGAVVNLANLYADQLAQPVSEQDLAGVH